MATVTGTKRHLGITSDTFDSNGDVVVGGNLTINGTTTTLDTANLLVEDKNIIIGNVSSPSDTTADGGGITLKGASDYTINWINANNRWEFNQGIYSSGAITSAGQITGTELEGTSLDINGNADISGNLSGIDTLSATTLSVGNYGLSSGDIPNNAANTTGLASHATNLNATDDRDIAPEDLSYNDDFRIFFAEKSGIEGGTVGSDYQDLLVLNSYSDSSGGFANALGFDKNSQRILHYNSVQTATNWGTPKTLAYTDNSSMLNSNVTLSSLGAAAASHNHAASDITSGTFAAARIAHNSFDIGDTTAETGRNVHETGIYTFNVNNGNLGTGTETAYYSVLGFGQGTGGSAQIAAKWTSSGEKLYYRSLRDTTDNWWSWREIYHTGHLPTLSELGAAPSSVVNQTDFVSAANGGTFSSAINIDASGGSDNYYLNFKEGGALRFYIYENSNNVYFNGGPGSTHFRPRQNGGTGNFIISGADFQTSANIQLGQYNTINWGSSSSNQLTIQNYLSGAGIVQKGGGNLEFQANTNDIVLKPASTERLRVHNGGNNGGIIIKGGSANWNETTPGTGEGAIHLDPESGTDHFGSAITFGASDTGNGANAHAGIYTRSDGSYGTKMYFATTDSYSVGSKTRMFINHNGNVGIGTTSPSEKLQVEGSVQHQGLTMTSGTSVDQIYSANMTYQLSAHTWTDTGINSSELATGTYAIQLFVDDHSAGGGHYDVVYSGMMSWYSSNTNSSNHDEIVLHRVGHATNTAIVQLRTLMHTGAGDNVMLQIKQNFSHSTTMSGTTDGRRHNFKFRRLI
ncbi:hypothetical protein N8445_00345 [bacterium]|nr:hypothetical protein [bacterium]